MPEKMQLKEWKYLFGLTGREGSIQLIVAHMARAALVTGACGGISSHISGPRCKVFMSELNIQNP